MHNLQPKILICSFIQTSYINDLSNNGKATGELIKIEGKILDKSCKPYPFCEIDIWQANSYGTYNHENDFSKNKIDEFFYGYKRITSDKNGSYFFTTIFPGSYKISKDIVRPPHIHLLVKTKNKKSLITQIYFKNHPHNKNDFIYQEGKRVFKFAVTNMANVSEEIMLKNNLKSNDISYLVPHQANKRIIDATAKKMGIGDKKVLMNIEKYGNTTAGTIPLCLWDFEKKLKKGDNLILSAFGGGFTWGSVYLKWSYNS